MSNKTIALIFAVQTVLFIYLNFELDDAGTIFLILAIDDGFLAYQFYRGNPEIKDD